VLLLHQLFPSLGQAYTAWEVFEEVQRRGGVRHIGICQVDLPTLETLYAKADVGLMVVQNYFASSTHFDKEVRCLCKQNGMYYQASGVFSAENSALLDHAVVARAIDTLEVGKHATLIAILLATAELEVERFCILYTSRDELHLKENWEAYSGFHRMLCDGLRYSSTALSDYD
jgi:diketogulonate reductase-like aldo/keto reductase